MSTKVEKKQATEQSSTPPALPSSMGALLFELENIALRGRKARFEILKKLMAEEGMDLTEAVYSRYGLFSSPDACVESLVEILNGPKADIQGISDRFKKAWAERLKTGASMPSGLAKILTEAKRRGFAIGTISVLQQEAADSIAAALGLGQWDTRVVCFSDVSKDFPRADAWLKAIKQLAKSPRRCGAITSSSKACKSALSADFRCAAVPDEFTAFQDFSGADLILENLADVPASEFLDALGLVVRK